MNKKQISKTVYTKPEIEVMHILIEIPQDADNFVYMQRITEITKGVLSFVNVRLTFIGYSLSVFTMDL